MYHAVDDDPSVISISPAAFACQMQWLRDEGFQVIELSKLTGMMLLGQPLPARSVAITFDDGFESVYTTAFPILAQHGFPATIFLVSGYCGLQNDWPGQPIGIPSRHLLSWAQILEMDRHGIEFGSHTVTHPRLDQLSPDEVEREVLASRDEIEQRLGHRIECFAYPYGRYDRAIEARVREAYSGACTTRLGLVGPGSDALSLERVDVYYLRRSWLFQSLGGPMCSPYLAIRRSARTAVSRLFRRPWG